MHLVVITNDYPEPRKNNFGAFVQARVDIYERHGHIVDVISRKNANDHTGTPYHVNTKTLERTSIDDAEVRSLDGDIALVHTPLPGLVFHTARAIMNTNRMPVITYIHGSEGIRTPIRMWTTYAMEIAWKRFIRNDTINFLNRCTRIVTCSRWMRDEIRQYFRNPYLIHVIPNPIDDHLFTISKHQNILGCTLRGTNKKYGLDILRKAIERNHNRTIVSILKPIFPRSVLPTILSAFSYFVSPARMEGQGVMMCEAAATGMPILATNVGGIPEFIDGWPHILVPPTVHDLAWGLRAMTNTLSVEGYINEHDRQHIRERILSVCGSDVVYNMEWDLFTSTVWT